MDIENVKSWASQPDVCRCCLSASGTWDVTASYLTDSAIKEVYLEMLRDCYGINLSYTTEWGPSRMVCKLCVGHLREASNFREQVLTAEKHFMEYWASRDNLAAVEIKIEDGLGSQSPPAEGHLSDGPPHSDDNLAAVEIKTEDALGSQSPPAEGHLSDGPPHSDDKEKHTDTTIDAPAIPINSEKENKSKRKKQKGVGGRRKKKKIEIDYDSDSDVPIAALLEKNAPSANGNKADENDVLNETTSLPVKGQPTVAKSVKQVSERKRVMTTCDVVLRATSACPFRHHKSWFQCFFCPQDFMAINLLREHTLKTHSNIDTELKKIKRYPRSLQIEISNLECRICHFNLTDVNEMRRHLADAHQKVIYPECIADYKVDSSPYSCHLCNQEFHVFRTLTTHLNEHYANCICDVCGKSFLNSKRLKVHKRTHESGDFPCSECGKVLKTKTSKANHMESVHSKRQMKCQICLKPMKHYNDRIKHMSEVHDITHKFKCPICGREYNIKHYLATHIRQTHGHKTKKCSECGMAFITNHGLKKHMLKHSGVKPYSCTVCSKSYARNYTLREHMRAHEVQGERAFLCQE